MSKDIDEMENMLNDYLQFAKTQAQEETTTKIYLIFKRIKERFNNDKI